MNRANNVNLQKELANNKELFREMRGIAEKYVYLPKFIIYKYIEYEGNLGGSGCHGRVGRDICVVESAAQRGVDAS